MSTSDFFDFLGLAHLNKKTRQSEKKTRLLDSWDLSLLFMNRWTFSRFQRNSFPRILFGTIPEFIDPFFSTRHLPKKTCSQMKIDFLFCNFFSNRFWYLTLSWKVTKGNKVFQKIYEQLFWSSPFLPNVLLKNDLSRRKRNRKVLWQKSVHVDLDNIRIFVKFLILSEDRSPVTFWLYQQFSVPFSF